MRSIYPRRTDSAVLTKYSSQAVCEGTEEIRAPRVWARSGGAGMDSPDNVEGNDMRLSNSGTFVRKFGSAAPGATRYIMGGGRKANLRGPGPRQTRRVVAVVILSGLLAVIGLALPGYAATAQVTVSNPSLSGTAPIKVGDSITFSASLSGVTGAVGDTFTISLPAELDFAGAISFEILNGYGQCSWSGKVATCVLTKTATNASGGVSLWLKATGTHTGSSNITIGGTTVKPTVPGGSIGTAPSGGSSSNTPVVTHPTKRGQWNDYYSLHPETYGVTPVLAEWDLWLPNYSVNTKVTISDSLVSGNGYSAQSYWFGNLAWILGHRPVTAGGTYDGSATETNDVRWNSSTAAIVDASGNVTDAVLTVSADKKSFTLTFTAKVGVTYHLRYFTTPDSTPVSGDLLKNNVTVNGYQTDTVVKVAGASAWLREDYAQFAIKKVITGTEASDVPVGTNFAVRYHYVGAGGATVVKNMTVPYNMLSVASDWVPAGTTFTISEISLPTIDGVSWGNYTLTGTGVTKNSDGTYSVTPAAGTTAQLSLTNIANSPPVPSVVIVKKDVAGHDADTVASSVDLTGSGGSTGLVFTITNDGTEALTDVVVSDEVTAGSATVSGLSCDFSPLGGPSSGTRWAAGPFKVGDSFTCTAQLDGVVVGEQHTDVASVKGVGVTSKIPVDDDNPYNATVVPPTPVPSPTPTPSPSGVTVKKDDGTKLAATGIDIVQLSVLGLGLMLLGWTVRRRVAK